MSIRIIAGEFKNRELYELKNPEGNVRPILARVRKSLFDILTPRLADSKFLDLYSGTGAVGIEAVSRGVQYSVFVDLQLVSIDVLKKNIEKLGIAGKSFVFQADITGGLQWVSSKISDKFDIIFMGPPYKEKLVNATLQAISQSGILADSGIIIAQHHAKEEADTELYNMYRQKKYGDTILSFYNKKKELVK